MPHKLLIKLIWICGRFGFFFPSYYLRVSIGVCMCIPPAQPAYLPPAHTVFFFRLHFHLFQLHLHRVRSSSYLRGDPYVLMYVCVCVYVRQ